MADSMQIVHVRVNDAATGKPTAVRIRFTDAEGNYLPPLGHSEFFSTRPWDEVGGDVRIGEKKFAYIDGACEIRLPSGTVNVEIKKGPEYHAIRQSVERKFGRIALRFAVERKILPCRGRYFSGDMRAHLLTTETASLEAAAENLDLVNLLIGEFTFENKPPVVRWASFSGQSPAAGAVHAPAFVNTYHRGWSLGDLALLNCHRVVFPMNLDAPGFEHYALMDLCGQCHRKGGLVVWPDFPGAPGERLADLILGGIDAVEWSPATKWENAYALWYGLWNCGFRVPLVGGSGKKSNRIQLGAIRTYVALPEDEPLSYHAWIEGIRAGRCYATRRPLLDCAVEAGPPPFARLRAGNLRKGDRIEFIRNGDVLHALTAESDLLDCQESLPVAVPEANRHNWYAVRCYSDRKLMAHSSPVYSPSDAGSSKSDSAAVLLGELERNEASCLKSTLAEDRGRRLRQIFADARAKLQSLVASP